MKLAFPCVCERHFDKNFIRFSLLSQIAERWGLSRSQKFEPVIKIWSGDPAAPARPSNNPINLKHHAHASGHVAHAKHNLEEQDDREAWQQLRRLDTYRLAFERCGHCGFEGRTFRYCALSHAVTSPVYFWHTGTAKKRTMQLSQQQARSSGKSSTGQG